MSGRARAMAMVGLVLAAGATLATEAEPPAPPAEAPAAVSARAAQAEVDAPYDPTGRRDPFRPPRTATSISSGTPRTPLQRYEIGQLKLVAVIWGATDSRAVVEDQAGLGYIVKVGTPIGANGGAVEKIERGRVLVREETIDYYGETQSTEVVMEMASGERGKE